MKIVSRPELFTVVAGKELLEAMEIERDRCDCDDDIHEMQRRQSMRGIIGVEIIVSSFGCSVRYDSGFQNFGLVAGSRSGELDGTIEDAERYAREWVARDPQCRYAWKRTGSKPMN